MPTDQQPNKEKQNTIPPKTGVGGAETMNDVEMTEVGSRLSEIVSTLPPEEKPVAPSPAKKSHKLTPQQLKAKLLANLPSEKRMRTEIQAEIKKEIGGLQSRVRNMVYFGSSVNYFELNNMLARIRELTDILSSLAKAAFEMIKSLWFRFVHGIAL